MTTRLETWFERDRAHVALVDADTDETIFELWDDAVFEAVEDGFLDHRAFLMGKLMRPAALHSSMEDYARHLGLLEQEG